MADIRYIFVVEWFDTAASLVRTYNLTYFTLDKSIEMYDLKTRKAFLKKCEYKLDIADLYLGSVLNIFSRQLKIVDFADVFTRSKFQNVKEKTFAMIKPDAYSHIGKIIAIIEQSGLQISNLKMTKMSPKDAQEFYAEHRGKGFYENLVNFMSSDFIVGMELVGDNSIKRWRELLGPTNTQVAREQAPHSIRGQFGTDGTKNACHGSDSPNSAYRELTFFFGKQSTLKTTAFFSNCSCAVIKPHVVKAGQVGAIVDTLLSEGFEISAFQSFQLDRPTAEEFYNVYQGVVPEYTQMTEHLTQGICFALEIRQENAVKQLRELTGPHDPEIARIVRPTTLRARFGIDKVKNGIHCTDLEDDGVLEVEYFFNALQ